MSKIDLRECNEGDMLISSLGGVLEYIAPTPYKNLTYLDHVVRYVRDIDGKPFPDECYGTRNHDGLTYPKNPKPETDHDIVAIIVKTIASKAPIVRVFNGYVILAQSLDDLKAKQANISRGDVFGYYTVDMVKPRNK